MTQKQVYKTRCICYRYVTDPACSTVGGESSRMSHNNLKVPVIASTC